jgi:hypothetical protein
VRYTDGKLFGYVRQRPVDETFTLPADAAPEAAVAAMRSGVLCISIPRRCVDAQSCAPLQCSEGAKLGPSSNPDSST